jgi:hypothetical protein
LIHCHHCHCCVRCRRFEITIVNQSVGMQTNIELPVNYCVIPTPLSISMQGVTDYDIFLEKCRLLHQMTTVSLQHQTQQRTLLYNHCCHSVGCWWSLSGASTFQGVTTELQWRQWHGRTIFRVVIARVLLYLKLN